MRAVVVYESMYGNTHVVADMIAQGLRAGDVDADVVPVDEATGPALTEADLLVVGGPTHAHGLSRESTRRAGRAAADKPESPLVLDPSAAGEGIRDWLASTGHLPRRAAAFDTRIDAPAVLTGRAAKGIAKHLRANGCELVVAPESFLVTKGDALVVDEAARARRWGGQLADAIGARTPPERAQPSAG